MESLITLEYPNGRTHQATLASTGALRPGDEFDLHGRRWRAVGPVPGRRYGDEPRRILCRPTSGKALDPSSRRA